jgi:periplasmic protein TonB
MSSNSTVATIPHSSLEKGESRCATADLDMGTYNNSPSGSDHCIAHPSFRGPRLRNDLRIAAFPGHEKGQRRLSSRLQEGDLFYDSLVASGVKPRPRNLWATVGPVVLLSLVLLALIVIPLLQIDPLPKAEKLTMLYFQAPPAAGAKSTNIQTPKPTSTYTPTSVESPIHVHTTQEAPKTPADSPSGVVGGVPGGVVGGIPGGVLGEVLGSTGSAPAALAKTRAPMPKRIRVPAQVAEANLIHDVAPQYPPEAGRERIQGTVVLMAEIAKDGTVRNVRVESGLPLLAQAAIDAVKQWRYKPYLLNGEPVEVDCHITINFALSS